MSEYKGPCRVMNLSIPPSVTGGKGSMVGVNGRQDGLIELEVVLGNFAQRRSEVAHRFSVGHASLRPSFFVVFLIDCRTAPLRFVVLFRSHTAGKSIPPMPLRWERISEETGRRHFHQTSGEHQTRQPAHPVAPAPESARYIYRYTPPAAS